MDTRIVLSNSSARQSCSGVKVLGLERRGEAGAALPNTAGASAEATVSDVVMSSRFAIWARTLTPCRALSGSGPRVRRASLR